MSDRKSHFRSLRATVLAWQRDEIDSLYRSGRGSAPVFDRRPQRPYPGGQFGRRNQPDDQSHPKRSPREADQPTIANEKLRRDPLYLFPARLLFAKLQRDPAYH